MAARNDEDILSLLRSSKTRDKGFSLLMDKYKERIYWHIRRIVVSHEDAQDILQDTFIKVYRFCDSFVGNSQLYTWIYRIATNECIRMFHDRKIDFTSYDQVSEILIDKLHEETTECEDTILVKFQEAVLRLPEKQKLVFNLRYYDELSYEEIAGILDSSVGTLKTNYHYASEKIKEYMINN